jgi:hypothetical protein
MAGQLQVKYEGVVTYYCYSDPFLAFTLYLLYFTWVTCVHMSNILLQKHTDIL